MGVNPIGARGARILLLTEQIEPGGKRSHVEALYAGLVSHGWNPGLFDRHDLSLAARAFVAGPARALDLIRRGLGHRWLVPAFERVLLARLRERRLSLSDVGIFHVQEATSFRAVRRASGGRPVALTVHGPIHREVASAYGMDLSDPIVQMLRSVEERACREADAVVAVDRAHADYVRSFGRADRIWSIANFVDTRRFNPGIASGSFPSDVEHWIDGRPILLCTRRLVPKNGVDVAVRAARVLADRRVSFALVIVGDGPQGAELQTLIKSLDLSGHVRLLGGAALERIPGWCRRASIVIVPSVPRQGVVEATSISVLEAQACACPVVASAIGGILEIVEDGVSGVLVPPGEPESLASAIQRILADRKLVETLAETGWSRVQERHSHVAGALRYIEVYRALGASPPGTT